MMRSDDDDDGDDDADDGDVDRDDNAYVDVVGGFDFDDAR